MSNIRNLYGRAMALEDDGTERVLRQAANPNERTVVTTGPLSQQFTDELNRTFAKVDPVTGGAQPENRPVLAQESQAQDITVLQNLVTNLSRAAVSSSEQPAGDVSGGETTIYGIKEADLTPERIVEITTEISERDKAADMVVVVEPTVLTSNANSSTAPVERVEEVDPNARPDLRSALEAIVNKLGSKVYPSLEMFCKACEDEAAAAEADPETSEPAAPAADTPDAPPADDVPADGDVPANEPS
jgi:hypothetical protein